MARDVVEELKKLFLRNLTESIRFFEQVWDKILAGELTPEEVDELMTWCEDTWIKAIDYIDEMARTYIELFGDAKGKLYYRHGS